MLYSGLEHARSNLVFVIRNTLFSECSTGLFLSSLPSNAKRMHLLEKNRFHATEASSNDDVMDDFSGTRQEDPVEGDVKIMNNY